MRIHSRSPTPSCATSPRSTGASPAAAEESGWTADRLGAVERNILRIAIHELDVGEIPPRAVIDEAVTLAKHYSTREAGRLVNGILDRIYREAA